MRGISPLVVSSSPARGIFMEIWNKPRTILNLNTISNLGGFYPLDKPKPLIGAYAVPWSSIDYDGYYAVEAFEPL